MADSITINGQKYRFDSHSPIDISIPLQFNGPQPNAYGVEEATSRPCVSGELIGDTRQGGSCNFERYTFIPHCNGTHTECIGHITNERISVRDRLTDVFIPATLISVQPESVHDTNDTYSPSVRDGDMLITKACIDGAPTSGALIIRTLPNGDDKLTTQYGDHVPPYFTTEAMEFMLDAGVRHLLVDLPSVDRLFDGGRLLNHRIFWNVEPGSFEANRDSRRECTITELIYVPSEAEDGEYVLNLQIAPFASDATPSRPILFALSDEA